LDKRIFEEQFISKREIRKSVNEELQLNLNYPGCYISAATVRDFSIAQNPKMVMMVPCDETHILYTVGKRTERRTQRDEELTKWLSGLGEN
jgi:hypothetical protein